MKVSPQEHIGDKLTRFLVFNSMQLRLLLLSCSLAVLQVHARSAALRASNEPAQINRLDKLAAAIGKISPITRNEASTQTTSSSVSNTSPSLDSTTTATEPPRFQVMSQQEATQVQERIKQTRSKLAKVEQTLADYKAKHHSENVAPAETTETTKTTTDITDTVTAAISSTSVPDNKQQSAAKLSDAPSDRPLHQKEAQKVQSLEREDDLALREQNRFGSTRTNSVTPAAKSNTKSFIASIPPIQSTELEYPTFPEQGVSDAADNARTDDEWARTDAMAEQMSEGQMQQMQQEPPSMQLQQQQQPMMMDPRMMMAAQGMMQQQQQQQQ